MNPFREFRKLLLTCVDTSPEELSKFICEAGNVPHVNTPLDEQGVAIRQYYCAPTNLDFSLAYNDIPPSSRGPLSAIFWTPKNRGSGTAFMSNTSDGMQFTVFALSERTPYRWVHICIGDSSDLPYPAVQFYYYDDYQTVNRHIIAQVDDKWVFFQKGEPFPFEKPEFYTQRKIKDRLTRALVTEYMQAIGFDIAANEFWQTEQPAWHLWQVRPSR